MERDMCQDPAAIEYMVTGIISDRSSGRYDRWAEAS